MITNKVTAALLLQDDFSGDGITGPQQRFLLGGRYVVPIRKQEGFYVFTQALGNGCELTITSAGYEPMTLRLEEPQDGSPPQILQVRLMRAPGGSTYDDSYCIEGTCRPCSRVVAMAEEESSLRFQSIGVKDGRHWLLLQGYSTRQTRNRRFCITEGKKREYFIITAQNSDGTYEIEAPFRESFSPGSLVRRVYTTRSGTDGRYSLYVEPDQKPGSLKVECLRKEGAEWGCSYVPVLR